MDHLANKNIKITSTTVKNYKPGFQYSKTKSITNSTRKFNYSATSLAHNSLTHLTPIKKNNTIIANPFATMDIETMEYNNTQIPVAISICLPQSGGSKSKIFLLRLDSTNAKADIDLAINNLWKDVFTYLIHNLCFAGVIFVHNLGSFDGFFIYKYLSIFTKPFLQSLTIKINSFKSQMRRSRIQLFEETHSEYSLYLYKIYVIILVSCKVRSLNIILILIV